jgi:hypothetical protein
MIREAAKSAWRVAAAETPTLRSARRVLAPRYRDDGAPAWFATIKRI